MKLHPSTEILDASKTQDYMTCPRYFFYRHVCGWRPDQPQFHLVFGKAIHAALDTLYRYGFGDKFGPKHTKDVQRLAYADFLLIYRSEFDEETDNDFGTKNPYSADKAIEEYCVTYHDDLTRYEVLVVNDQPCVEVSGFVPLSHDLQLYFRQDVILRNLQTGQIFTLEHKTASYFGGPWSTQWALSMQVGTYTHALYSLFPREQVFGVRVNGIAFLKGGPDFMRVPCEKSYTQMQTWATMARFWLDAMQNDLSDLQVGIVRAKDQTMSCFPLNPTACTNWNKTCAYHPFCTSWENPLQHWDQEEPPIGFVCEHWNPTVRRDRSVQKMNRPNTEEFKQQ